jgi:hypothetical protein
MSHVYAESGLVNVIPITLESESGHFPKGPGER